MSEEESILINSVTNKYYKEFSQLVAKHVSSVPEHLQDDMLVILQEHSSCYGSNYSAYMTRKTPLMQKLNNIIFNAKENK